jgi:hypothetical protein
MNTWHNYLWLVVWLKCLITFNCESGGSWSTKMCPCGENLSNNWTKIICWMTYMWPKMIIYQLIYIHGTLNKIVWSIMGRIPIYDVARIIGQRKFTLRTILMWTIHDYLAYGFVSRCVHQGYKACASCGLDICC